MKATVTATGTNTRPRGTQHRAFLHSNKLPVYSIKYLLHSITHHSIKHLLHSMTGTKHIRHSETQLKGSSFKRCVSLAACIKSVDFFLWKIYLSDNIYQNYPRLHLQGWLLWWLVPNHCCIPAVSVRRTRARTSRKPRKVTSCLEKLLSTANPPRESINVWPHFYSSTNVLLDSPRIWRNLQLRPFFPPSTSSTCNIFWHTDGRIQILQHTSQNYLSKDRVALQFLCKCVLLWQELGGGRGGREMR